MEAGATERNRLSDSGDGVTPTKNGCDGAPEERVRRWDEVAAALQRANVLGQRWDEVADALEGANVLRQLAELARVPEEKRVEFCRQVSNLVSDMWTYDIDRRALVVAKQKKSLSRAIDALQAAKQALADLDEESREALKELIVQMELGITMFLACMREESGPARRRAHRRGRRPGTVKNWLFAAFVVKLRIAVRAAGGRLGLQKNIEKGALLEAIKILVSHLPEGLVPKRLSASTLQRIITGR
jgi:ribosomal protein L22